MGGQIVETPADDAGSFGTQDVLVEHAPQNRRRMHARGVSRLDIEGAIAHEGATPRLDA